MQYVFMALMVLGIVGLDQLSKVWVIYNIAPSNSRPELMAILKDLHNLTDSQIQAMPQKIEGVPGIFSLTHWHNTGAAWSTFEGMTWLFALVFVLFAAFLVWEFSKNKLGFTALERWCLVAVFGGGLGNMIDRIRLGFVVDMIEVDFIRFPVFNVADCFISCGCILLLVHLIFFNRQFWKDEKK